MLWSSEIQRTMCELWPIGRGLDASSQSTSRWIISSFATKNLAGFCLGNPVQTDAKICKEVSTALINVIGTFAKRQPRDVLIFQPGTTVWTQTQ